MTNTSTSLNKNLKTNSISKTPIKTVSKSNNIVTNKSSLIQAKLNQVNYHNDRLCQLRKRLRI